MTGLAAATLLVIASLAQAGGPSGNGADIFDTVCTTDHNVQCVLDADCPNGGRCKIIESGPTLNASFILIADALPSDNFDEQQNPAVTVLIEIKVAGQRHFLSKTFQSSSNGNGTWPEIGEWFAFDLEIDCGPDGSACEGQVGELAGGFLLPNWKFNRPCFGLKPIGDALIQIGRAAFPDHDFLGETPVITKLKRRRSDTSAQDTFTSDLGRVARYSAKISFVTLSASTADCSEAEALPTCGGTGGNTCPTGLQCVFDSGVCGLIGTCKVPPLRCSSASAPVCGCDATTYLNACEAERVGISIHSDGPCP